MWKSHDFLNAGFSTSLCRTLGYCCHALLAISLWSWASSMVKRSSLRFKSLTSRKDVAAKTEAWTNCLKQFGWFSLSLGCHMSDCENPRFTERTSTNLGRSHRLPHVCTIMIYGKLGGYRLQETAAFIYIDELWIICDIWVSLMWILEKYDDITLKRGIASLGRSHRLPRVFNNFHQFP